MKNGVFAHSKHAPACYGGKSQTEGEQGVSRCGEWILGGKGGVALRGIQGRERRLEGGWTANGLTCRVVLSSAPRHGSAHPGSWGVVSAPMATTPTLLISYIYIYMNISHTYYMHVCK